MQKHIGVLKYRNMECLYPMKVCYKEHLLSILLYNNEDSPSKTNTVDSLYFR